MPTMRQSRRSLMMVNRRKSSSRPQTKRDQFTTAQSIRSFLETGSVISPSEDGFSNSQSNIHDDSFDNFDVCLRDDEDDEDEDDEANDRAGSRTTGTTDASVIPMKIGALESTRVRTWRVVVICSILAIGFIVSTLTFVTLRQEIIADSNDAFRLFVDTMENAFQTQMLQVVAANRALSHAITTAAVTAEASDSFPNFIVPSFEVYAHEARQLSRSDVFMYAPIVEDDAPMWSRYATQTSAQWLQESKHIFDLLEPGLNRSSELPPLSVSDTIWGISDDGRLWPWQGSGMFVPSLHTSPPPISDLSVHQNINLFSNENYMAAGLASIDLKHLAFTRFQSVNRQFSDAIYGDVSKHDDDDLDHDFHPHSVAAQPVYRSLDETSDTVGFLYSIVAWKRYLAELLPARAGAIDVVLKNDCGQMVTYCLKQDDAIYKGEGDLHNPSYSHEGRTIEFTHISQKQESEPLANTTGHCQVMLHVYPTAEFQAEYNSILPNILSATIGVLFGIMAIVFAIYDRVQSYLNTAVVDSATRSNAIVSSLFPSNVRDRLLAQATVPVSVKPQNRHASMRKLPVKKSSKEDDNSDPVTLIKLMPPIADLFPATTVLFADVVGFTAWSSTREASQVFTLLEAVYQAFDEIASKRGIFKVETIGDCYVAVSGLPDPTDDHAVNMARFARKCLIKMLSLVKKLESSLGPDTSDLTLRIGMHSGPVTAGVLRGERSRFQLFGDTVNTASRMESTGKPNRIQLSQETARLLEAAGKSAWIRKREDKVHAKGKGLLQTYYLELRDVADADASRGDMAFGNFLLEQNSTDHLVNDDEVTNQQLLAKNARLVTWNTNVLLKLLKEIAAKRCVVGSETEVLVNERLLMNRDDKTVLDEVEEIITLPGIESTVTSREAASTSVDRRVAKQLHAYLTTIASMYRNNPFHNFDHATHVAMSVVKLLSRIVAPSSADLKYKPESALIRGDHTYGITSDPLTQFSCILSALIHDVDHSGVPNATLVKEQSELARRYEDKSIAEQNSVDLAWNVLMEDQYRVLRSAIYSNDTELNRFRQLIVNSVMATDIVDQQQKAFRNARWDRAFCSQDLSSLEESEHVAINRKATIVIEHLIQASDVAHTMQHWHIYRRWNERFFRECYQAYQAGRADVDPSINWYQGEIGFFDFYIIPLAKKLKDCGVFGVSSDEYLNYAVQNRHEWESRGKEIVQNMIEKENSGLILI